MKKILRAIAREFRSLTESFVLEFKQILRDQGVVLFFLFLPLAYPVVYSLIYNPELVREVGVVVVDNDRTASSRELVRRFGATEGADIVGYAADLPEAKKAMHERCCYAVLEIPQGFDRKLGNGEQGLAMLYCDMSLLLRYRSLLFAATDVSLAMGADIQAESLSRLGVSSIGGADPMPVESVQLGNLQGGFDSFVMPGVLILILQQCIVLAVGMMGGARYERARRGINPVNAFAGTTLVTMIGRTVCYLTVLTLPVLWLIHFVPTIFEFPMAGDTLSIFAFILPLMLASIALGFIVQTFVREREAIFIIWVATSVLFLFLSGLTWPSYAMPPFWQYVSDLIPATWGVNGFIKMNANGSTLSQVGVCYENLWMLTLLYFVVAWILHKFYLRPHLSLEAERTRLQEN